MVDQAWGTLATCWGRMQEARAAAASWRFIAEEDEALARFYEGPDPAPALGGERAEGQA